MKKYAIMTMERHENRGKGTVGSSRIRGDWVLKYWKEAEHYRIGKKYEGIILQKVYWLDFVKEYKGIKILDICVSGDSLIFTSKGWKYSKEIKQGDFVLTDKGRFRKVLRVYKRQNKIIKIKACGLCDLKVTDNHPILVQGFKYDRGKFCLIDEPKYKEAGKLRIYVRLAENKHNYGEMAVSLMKREYQENQLDKELGWFWGYYSAEGSRGDHQISFALSSNEIAQRNRIKYLIKKIFDKKPTERKLEYNGLNIYFGSKELVEFVKSDLKSGKDKEVIKEIFNAPIKTKLAFLEGYIAGDGYCNDYGGISVSSISKKLTYSVWQLFRDCGICANINYHKRDGENCCFIHKDGKKYRGNPCWRIQLNPKESIKFWELTEISRYKKCRIDYWRSLKSKNIETRRIGNHLLHPVRRIKLDDKVIQTVYNFEIEEDNSFIVDGIITHNCDPDFLSGKSIKEIIDHCDAVTVSTQALKDNIDQFAEKPVIVVPDRIDFDEHRKVKTEFGGVLQKAIWFGYSHNFEILKPCVPLLKNSNVKLTVVSDREFRGADHNIILKPWNIKVLHKELIKADIALMPEYDKGKFLYKSNNKTLTCWALRLPVVATPQDLLERLRDPKEREREAGEKYKYVRENFDILLNVKQYQKIIEEIKYQREKG